MPLKTAVPKARRSRPCAAGNHQRQHAQDERERGHHNGPQPQAAGFQRRLAAGIPDSRFVVLVGLASKNAILDR